MWPGSGPRFPLVSCGYEADARDAARHVADVAAWTLALDDGREWER